MNWKIVISVIVVNSLLCWFQYFCQKKDIENNRIQKRHSIIPGTSHKFLHWQDFYTQTYGDILGLVWIMNAFVHLLIQGLSWPVLMILILLVVILFSTLLILSSCLDGNHKPDWGFPTVGTISLGGISHVPYFSLLLAMSVVCIIEAIAGQLTGLLLTTSLIGGMIWIICFFADLKTGHFDPLHNSISNQKTI